MPFARETSCDRLMPSLADGKHTNELCHRILAASYGAKGIDLQRMFRSYDKDGNGALTRNELKLVCKRLVPSMSEQEFSGFVQQCDVNGDETIDFEEFSQMLAPASPNRKKKLRVEVDENRAKPTLRRHSSTLLMLQHSPTRRLMATKRQNTLREIKQNIGTEDLDQHFGEKTTAHVKAQGDLSHYTIDNILRREKLKAHKGVLSAVRQFWDATDMIKDSFGNIKKQQYLDFNLKLHLALVPDVDIGDAKQEAEADWEKDCNRARVQESAKNASAIGSSLGHIDESPGVAREGICFQLFFESLFELADTWCENICGDEYSEFLMHVLTTISVDGTVGKLHDLDRTTQRATWKPDDQIRFREWPSSNGDSSSATHGTQQAHSLDTNSHNTKDLARSHGDDETAGEIGCRLRSPKRKNSFEHSSNSGFSVVAWPQRKANTISDRSAQSRMCAGDLTGAGLGSDAGFRSKESADGAAQVSNAGSCAGLSTGTEMGTSAGSCDDIGAGAGANAGADSGAKSTGNARSSRSNMHRRNKKGKPESYDATESENLARANRSKTDASNTTSPSGQGGLCSSHSDAHKGRFGSADGFNSYYDMDIENMSEEERDHWKKYWGIECDELNRGYSYDGPYDDVLSRRKHTSTKKMPRLKGKSDKVADDVQRQTHEHIKGVAKSTPLGKKNSASEAIDQNSLEQQVVPKPGQERENTSNKLKKKVPSLRTSIPPINAAGADASTAMDTAHSLRAAQDKFRQKNHLAEAQPHSARAMLTPLGLPALKQNNTSGLKTNSFAMDGGGRNAKGVDETRRRVTYGGRSRNRSTDGSDALGTMTAAARSRVEFEQWQREQAAKHDKKTGRRHSPRTSGLLTSLSAPTKIAKTATTNHPKSQAFQPPDIFSPRPAAEAESGFTKLKLQQQNAQGRGRRAKPSLRGTISHARMRLNPGGSKQRRPQ